MQMESLAVVGGAADGLGLAVIGQHSCWPRALSPLPRLAQPEQPAYLRQRHQIEGRIARSTGP